MSTLRTIAAAALIPATLAVGLLASSQAAFAQANCDWYANTALQQQKINVDRKCGLKGESWSFARSSHIAWCLGVSPDQWKRQAQFRDQELAKCQAGATR